jgi:hypothetical protein
MRTAIILCGVSAILAACGGTQKPETRHDDAGADGQVDGGEHTSDGGTDGGNDDGGQTGPTCGGKAALSLTSVPEDVFAFHHVSSECDSLKPLFLVRNDGEHSVRVERVSVAPAQFSASVEGLPRQLAPGETLPVSLGFSTDEALSVEGVVTVSGPDGCSELKVYGEGVPDSLTTQSAYALDFGEVPAGTTSAPREVVILSQHEAADTSVTIEGFSAGPEGVFEVTPVGAVTPESCQEVKVSITFTAPASEGAVAGDLGWGYLITSPSGTFSASAGLPLFGTSVAR